MLFIRISKVIGKIIDYYLWHRPKVILSITQRKFQTINVYSQRRVKEKGFAILQCDVLLPPCGRGYSAAFLSVLIRSFLLNLQGRQHISNNLLINWIKKNFKRNALIKPNQTVHWYNLLSILFILNSENMSLWINGDNFRAITSEIINLFINKAWIQWL